jgi:hypothetical protein
MRVLFPVTAAHRLPGLTLFFQESIQASGIDWPDPDSIKSLSMTNSRNAHLNGALVVLM